MKSIVCLVLLSVMSLYAAAQDHPKAELFAGYSALITESEEDAIVIGTDRYSVKRETGFLNGWNASLAYNPTKWLGFVGDFSGHYGSIDSTVSIPGQSATIGLKTHVHTLLFGPQFSARHDSYTAFARVLVGAAILDQSISVLGISASGGQSGFAFAAGGGFDVKINDRISWRAVQADYIRMRFGEPKLIINGQKLSDATSINTFRISSGFVFRN